MPWEPDLYLRFADQRDLQVTAWQAMCFHVLEGEDPILEWKRGTTLRPELKLLASDEHGEFLSEYATMLREAYPVHEGKTDFPFKRTFVVAHRKGLQ